MRAASSPIDAKMEAHVGMIACFMFRTLLCVTTAVGMTSPAAADLVAGPSTPCLPGSRAVLAHHGPVCELATCSSSADCARVRRSDGSEAPGSCQQRRLCVRDISYSGPSGRAPANVRHTVVVGTCDGSACREDRVPWEDSAYANADGWTRIGDARCEEQNVCLPEAEADSQTETPTPTTESAETETTPTTTDTPERAEASGSGCNTSSSSGLSMFALVFVFVFRRGDWFSRQRQR